MLLLNSVIDANMKFFVSCGGLIYMHSNNIDNCF